MAGYSGTPLERKLGIRPADVVLLDGAPDALRLDAATTRRLPRSVRISLTFHTSRTRLEKRFGQLVERTTQDGMIWVCWPKKSSGVPTDLSDGVVRQIGLDAGLVDVKVCAIDETWSGLKFVRRLIDRT